MDSAETLVAGLDNLPTLSEVPLRVLREIDGADPSVEGVAELIALDPSLAANVVKLANSPLFPARRPASSVAQAVVRLGLQEVRTVVTSIAVMDAFPAEISAIDMRELWRHMIATAALARRFSRDMNEPDANTTYLAGLFHGLGDVVLALCFPSRFELAVLAAEESGRPTPDALFDEFKARPEQVCARMLERWNIPETVVDAVEFHTCPDEAPRGARAARTVLAARLTARVFGIGLDYPGDDRRNFLGEIPDDILAASAGQTPVRDYLALLERDVERLHKALEALLPRAPRGSTPLLS